MLTESLLKKLPKNVSEIEFKNDHKNYVITKVDDPDTDDEEDDNENENEHESDKRDSFKSEETIVAIPTLSNVIDLISDDEDEAENVITTTTTTNNGHQVTTRTVDIITFQPPNKRPRVD